MPQVGRWNGTVPTTPPSFTSVQDYLDYVDSLGPLAGAPTIADAAQVRAHPNDYTVEAGYGNEGIRGGNVKKKDSWLTKHGDQLGKAVAIAGGAVATGGAIAGLAAPGAAAGATTAVPSMPWTLGAGAQGLLPAAPASFAANAALATAPTAGANAAGTLGAAYTGNVATNAGGGLWGGLQRIGSGLFGGGSGNGNLWGPLAASSGLDLVGGYLGSRAANKAAEQQLEFGNKALDFEKQRYADAQGNLKPWIDNGTNAVNTIGSQLMPSSGPAPTAGNLAPQFMAPFQQNARNNGSNLVMMQAPDGSTQQVPGNMVPHFTSRGAKVIG